MTLLNDVAIDQPSIKRLSSRYVLVVDHFGDDIACSSNTAFGYTLTCKTGIQSSKNCLYSMDMEAIQKPGGRFRQDFNFFGIPAL